MDKQPEKTVTISADEYRRLKDKARAFDEILVRVTVATAGPSNDEVKEMAAEESVTLQNLIDVSRVSVFREVQRIIPYLEPRAEVSRNGKAR